MLLTTLDAWRAQAGDRFVLSEAGGVWAPDDDAALFTLADETFPSGQVVAADLTPLPGLAQGVVDRSPAGELRFLRRGPDGRHTALLHRPATAQALDLVPHPEGGWYRETWRAAPRFTPPGYPGERYAATGIYFLLPLGEESIWHAVRSDEVWLWHAGGPLTLLLGGPGDAPGEPSAITLGADLAAGQVPQALVPAGVWQAARPAADTEVLVSCVVSPGFDFADFRA
ncbi:cupin domain-containing protein [Actinomadura flavalba]|uniref:cupin domain-containing protein n=1 Tax=Actinomadura flavalba TaxID=1120938 RepID=UPI00037F11BB|nr:cupin domain-containing protein [Actinomadura flavalba]